MPETPASPPCPRETRAEALARLMPELQRRARRATRSRADAEDLAQEALLRVWARLGAGGEIDGIDAYLMVTMRRLARRQRAGAPHDSVEADWADPGSSAETRLFATEVMAAVASLPGAEAEMLMAIALEGTSYADYARRTGLPLGTVMSRLARTRQRLRAALDPPDPVGRTRVGGGLR
jgi:RNA polymerase sigma-70 factor (ECF subfamily)